MAVTKRTCDTCKIRKGHAKYFDAHFDWRNCPYDCRYAKEKEKEKTKDKKGK